MKINATTGEITNEPLSAERQAEKDAREQAWADDTAMREWRREMAETDGLPRWAEDMIDAYGAEGLPPETKALYDNKKAKRAEKP